MRQPSGTPALRLSWKPPGRSRSTSAEQEGTAMTTAEEQLSLVLWKKLGSEKDVRSDYAKYIDPIMSVLEIELEEKQEEIDDLKGLINDQEIEIEGLRR